MEESRLLNIYVDGACPDNGMRIATAGIGIWIAEFPDYTISERVPLTEKQTNNVAELVAIRRSIEICKDAGFNIHIYSDSAYATNCVNTWYETWKAHNFTTAKNKHPENLRLVTQIKEGIEYIRNKGNYVELTWVKAHAGNTGNENANTLAMAGSKKGTIEDTSHAVDILTRALKGYSDDHDKEIAGMLTRGMDVLQTEIDEMIAGVASPTVKDFPEVPGCKTDISAERPQHAELSIEARETLADCIDGITSLLEKMRKVLE